MSDPSDHPRSCDASQSCDAECVEARGAWPFVTYRVYQDVDRLRWFWISRHHRKGLWVPSKVAEAGFAEAAFSEEGNPPRGIQALLVSAWQPRKLNWWISILFAVGSLLFMAASLLGLSPGLMSFLHLGVGQVNATFFTGSIPFTIAAYLQLFQAANASEFGDGEIHVGELRASKRLVMFGWQPSNVGWLSSVLQFFGTVLFNFNTFDAMLPSLSWFQQDLMIWVPNLIGSILFLASGYLAFIEVCHKHWAWELGNLSWWVVFTNMLGCVAFMISALFAIVLPGGVNVAAVTVSIAFTLSGAIGFLVGSLLMLPEMSIQAKPSSLIVQ
ncbi:hypothetical protein N9D23_06995 [Rubripirellula sp.]|nr:hypothetical protein [Rubripirellula sp.]